MNDEGTMEVAWERTREGMEQLSDKNLRKLVKYARTEMHRRHTERWALKERLAGGFAAMANVMACAAWAMACRQALRESKEHEPALGVKPQSGEMWLPRELLYAVRHQVKRRGWHPITADSWYTVRNNLQAEERAERFSALPVRDSFDAVQFAVRMAHGEARSVVDDCFDRSELA